jgi:hypothetical protein
MASVPNQCGVSFTMLFEDRQRTRKEPLERGESLCDFYDSCALPGYEQFRSIINRWLKEMPEKDRQELISRMRYGGNREFGACLSELSVHAFLIRSGFKVTVHPEIPGTTTRPDFAALDEEGAVAAYVEVATVNPPVAQEKEENRENPLYKAIDGVKLPSGCALGYNLVRAGKSSPPLKAVVAEVEKWARENEAAAKSGVVSKTFVAGGWSVELELFAGGESTEQAQRAIGVAFRRGGVIEPHRDMREALGDKGKRYGDLKAPYVIVVADGKDQLFSKNTIKSALTEAVFGDEIVQFKNGGSAHQTFAGNGFWHGTAGARNRHVSAVLLLPDTELWKLRNENRQPTLAINPWAQRPLSDALRTLPRFESDNDLWVFREGNRFADILELPDSWPPEEADSTAAQ